MNDQFSSRVHSALDHFRIETPSWGFADTGTRFGKFFQAGAAINTEDKLADAGHVHGLTGCCPTVAVHALWDFSPDQAAAEVAEAAKRHGVRIGAVNPTLFQGQEYKLGSYGAPDAAVRQAAVQHTFDAIDLARQVDSKLLSLWFSDGTNYPGQDNIRTRKRRFTEALQQCHSGLDPDQIMLVEYKPFEPAFYHTDIADWGMAYLLAKSAGPQARVLVDTGHHYLSQNIEQIVAWLLDEGMLGGFHFNDRRYADDDLTLGSMDPYQIFRIFHEIHAYAADQGGKYTDISYVVDQCHNLKPKIEAMIQTVATAQDLYAKAALVDHKQLAKHQQRGEVVDAEEILKKAFNTDVSGVIGEWRESQGLAKNPLMAHRESGYAEAAEEDRSRRREEMGISQTVSFV